MRLQTVPILLFAFTACSCHAQTEAEQARLPYATVHKVVKVVMDLQGIQGAQEPRFVMSSDLPGVKPEDIKLYIDSRTGKIPLALNSDGTFSLPLREDLLKENPFIVANQPKGSMSLKADVSFRGRLDPEDQALVEQRKARYASLFFAGTISKAKELFWCEFIPDLPTNAPAVIHSKQGDIKVSPDQDGVTRIRYDAKLAGENPWVTFPSRGKWITRIEMELP